MSSENVTPKFTLRVPRELLDNVRLIAEHNCRSLNKEIETVLRKYVQDNQDLTKPTK